MAIRKSSISGIPRGNTSGRPQSPAIGDVYYNGELAVLEIFNGTNFVPCSAPAAPPTIAVVDVGTGRPYDSAQGTVTFTAGTGGGNTDSFIVSSSTGGYTATTTGTTATITVGDSGSYTFVGTAVNSFGESSPSPSVTKTLTTVPQAPTIGTATTSGANSDVTVTWTLGNNGGKNLSAITVTPYLNGTTAQTPTTAATTSSTSATIVGLTQGSAYTFKVKATNANGTGLESSATNSITVTEFFTFDALVIAGGGGGGANWAAGGGAGGVKGDTGIVKPIGTVITVTVGAGGGGGVSNANGSNGSSSSISGSNITTITTTGGGGGGKENTNGVAGGSGGGGGRGSTLRTGGAGTSGQGNAGGNNAANASGGGGGAGGVGGNGSGSTGGAGGVGTTTYSSYGSATSTGVNVGGTYYYAGGGGGQDGGAGGSGGGGGGAPSAGTAGTAGTANTGGGGGGGGGSFGAGGAGGSGIVILKVSGTYTATATTGSPARVVSGGSTYYTFTGSGSITL